MEVTARMTWTRTTRWAWGTRCSAAHRTARRLRPAPLPPHTATVTAAAAVSSPVKTAIIRRRVEEEEEEEKGRLRTLCPFVDEISRQSQRIESGQNYLN